MAKNDVLPEERVGLLKKLVKDNKITLIALDIETSLCKALVWGTGEQYVSEKNLLEPTRIIMAQYVFEGNNTPKLVTWDEKQDDKKVIEQLNEDVFNKPNLIIVGQNHKRFDLKIINDRNVAHGLKPITFKRIIQLDLLQLSRSSFRKHSHGLDYRSKAYGFGGKLPMEFNDWIEVYNGSKEALNKMARYGLKDPVDTLGVCWKELPYYNTLPAPLEALLREAKGHAQLICKDCESKRQSKYNVVFLNKKILLCKRCKKTWEINND
jgi:DNA polymerase elongation subunit (family B)